MPQPFKLLLLAAHGAAHASAQGVGGSSSTRLEQHSFQEGLSYNNTLASWTMLGSAIPTRGPFSLLPPVVDRAALFFHKQPVLTEDFDASFTFSAEGSSSSEHREGFGFWVCDRDITKDDASKRYMVEPSSSVGRQLQDAKWDLWGFPRTFRGFGVLFTNFVGTHELTANFRPSVDVVIGDGANEKRPWVDVPSPRAVSYDYRNTDITVDVRYNRGQLTVDCTARSQKQNIFTGSANLRSPSYIGFTGHTGETYGQRKDTPVDHVQLKSLTMNNYDTNTRGEDAADPNFRHGDAEHHKDFIHEYSSKAMERDESKTIVELTHVVNKLVSETEPLRHQMQHAIVTLTTKVQTLEDSLSKLKQTIQTTSGHKDLDAEFKVRSFKTSEILKINFKIRITKFVVQF